ncbi:DoxX family protein [Glaciihabitans sp. dw_435]|uniref:DoxX family protein n=1 Tax=Glaciihabitans sp. dw_435 TaxID=2720081 RepID=UPI001BD5D500|nr:DoxX family protein [Glaciihabitans sp. dw_435]
MTIAFWIIASITAFAFLGAGIMKLVRPVPALKAAGMGWVEDFSPANVKLIALAEAIGALGLILPPLTGIAMILSPIAGICLTVVMAGAVVVHLRRKESPGVAIVLTVLPLVTAILGFVVLA